MVDVAIVGASGYTGGELVRLLEHHPEVQITNITSRQHKDKPIYKVHPNLRDSNLKFEDINTKDLDVDLVFTATPHGASMNIVPDIIDNGSKVIDLSGDYRFYDIDVYEKWYDMSHKAPLSAVYGLPEIHRDKIKKADLVANPGCFPTGAILSSLPLSKNQLIDQIIFDSKTGISGAGITPTNLTHYPKSGDNVIPYNTTKHRHMPEIQQELGLFSDIKVSFTPHLVPAIRGILTTSHSFLKEDISKEEIEELYIKEYKNEPFVRVLDDGEIPTLSSVRGSNFVHVGCFEVDWNGRLVVISAIDNLVKGASGQAIQNMNLMCGFKESESIDFYGLSP